jgi:hypothetical protein
VTVLAAAGFIVRDANGRRLPTFYFEEEPGATRRGQAAHARRGAADCH